MTMIKRLGSALTCSLVATAALVASPLWLGDGAARAAEQDRVLRVGSTFLPPARGNPYKGAGSPSIFTWAAMFDALTWVNDQGKPVPALASGWRNINPTTWEFDVKPGLRFSNGEPVTASAVTSAIDWILSPEGQAKGPAAFSRLKVIERGEAVSDTKVRIVTKTPDPILPSRMAAMFLVAPRAWADMGVDGYAQEPASTGSYKLERWTAERATLTAFEDSWRPPVIRDLEVIEVPERSTRIQAFLSGQLDIAVGLSTENVADVRKDGHLMDVAISPQTLTIALVVDNVKEGVDNEPLQDVRVRQAMNYAINTEAMAEQLLGDKALAASVSISPKAFGHPTHLKPYPFDPSKARALLAEAGYADGIDVKFEVIPGAFPADNEIFQQLAAELTSVGIRTELQVVTFADWINKFYGMVWDGVGFETTADVAPSMDAMGGYENSSCLKGLPHYCTPESEALMKRISEEFDVDKREQLLFELAEYYYEQVPWIPLTYIVDFTAVSEDLAPGFQNVSRYMNYHELRFLQ